MVTREIQSPLSRIIAHDAVQSDLVLSTVELDFLHLQLEYLPLLHKQWSLDQKKNLSISSISIRNFCFVLFVFFKAADR